MHISDNDTIGVIVMSGQYVVKHLGAQFNINGLVCKLDFDLVSS
jgi:hypothetical protein